MSNSCDVISPCSCCYTNLSNSSATAPHHLRWPGCLLGALAGIVSTRTPTPAHNLTGVILSKNRPGALAQVSRMVTICKAVDLSGDQDFDTTDRTGTNRRRSCSCYRRDSAHLRLRMCLEELEIVIVQEALNTGWRRSEPAHDQLAHHRIDGPLHLAPAI